MRRNGIQWHDAFPAIRTDLKLSLLGTLLQGVCQTMIQEQVEVVVNQNPYVCETLGAVLLAMFSKVCENRRNVLKETLC